MIGFGCFISHVGSEGLGHELWVVPKWFWFLLPVEYKYGVEGHEWGLFSAHTLK